jgi:Galactokinase galactose-binding signature
LNACHPGAGDARELAPEHLRTRLATRSSADPSAIRVVQAPGRVNLIGEQTDYNLGYVLPAAVDLEIRIAFAPTTNRRVDLVSDTGERASIDLDAIGPSAGGLAAYVGGTAWALADAGIPTRGVDLFGEADRPLTIPLRQEDRASLAGTSRAAVNRVLRGEENAVRSRCNEAERPFSIDPGASTGRADIAGFARSTCTARTMGLRSRRILRRGPAATLYYSRTFAATVGIAPTRCPLERPAADRTRTPWPHRRRPVYWCGAPPGSTRPDS